jgi:hypothetical protein
MGWTDDCGYGKIRNKSIKTRAHRWFYELYKGKIEEGKVICHTCDTPSCVNPDHLYQGTQQDNIKDRVLRKRGGSSKIAGENNLNSKLTKEDVLEIRNSNKSLSFFAKKFGMGTSQIHRIRKNQSWKDV